VLAVDPGLAQIKHRYATEEHLNQSSYEDMPAKVPNTYKTLRVSVQPGLAIPHAVPRVLGDENLANRCVSS
jgi:hypothetical protein